MKMLTSGTGLFSTTSSSPSSSGGGDGNRNGDVDVDVVTNNNSDDVNNNRPEEGQQGDSLLLPMEPEAEQQQQHQTRSSWMFPPSIVGHSSLLEDSPPPSPKPAQQKEKKYVASGEVEEQPQPPLLPGSGTVVEPSSLLSSSSSSPKVPPVDVIDTSRQVNGGGIMSDWQRIVIQKQSAAGSGGSGGGGGVDPPEQTHGCSFQHVLEGSTLTSSGGVIASSAAGSVGAEGNQQLGRGVLILDGLSHTDSAEENHGDGGEDRSTLSLPGSVPSDPGSIEGSHVEEHKTSNGGGGEDEDHTTDANWELSHLLTTNLARARHLLSPVPRSTGNGGEDATTTNVCSASRFNNEGASAKSTQKRAFHRTGRDRKNANSSNISSGIANFRDMTSTVVARRGWLPTLAVALLVVGGGGGTGVGIYRYQQRQRAEQLALQRTLAEVQLQNEQLQKEEEALRVELQFVQEEARAAAAAALAAELENEELMGRLHRRHGHRRSNANKDKKDGDFDWSQCNAAGASNNDEDGTSTFSLADNCWVKATTDVQMGDCGEDTVEYLKDLWYGLWDNIDSGFSAMTDFSYVTPPDTTDSDSKQRSSQNPYTNEEYVPLHDPFTSLVGAIHSAGQNVGAKFAEMMKDEAAKASDVENVIQEGLSQASTVLRDIMNDAKRDVKDWSREAVVTLQTAFALKQNQDGESTTMKGNSTMQATKSHRPSQYKEQGEQKSPQPVTRKGLNDAANALSSLTKTWHDAIASLALPLDVKAEPVEEAMKDTKTESST